MNPRTVGNRLAALRRRWPQATSPREADLLDALDRAGAVGPSGVWLGVRLLAALAGQRWHRGCGARYGMAWRLHRLEAAGAVEWLRQPWRGCVRLRAGVRDRAGIPAGTPLGDC